jgi:hypothetical protein
MWDGQGHYLLIILLSAIAKTMADKFELSNLTFCQTTSVLYLYFSRSKGKNAVFSEKMRIIC